MIKLSKWISVAGNPGSDHFYTKFGTHLLETLAVNHPKREYVFLAISHLNHVKSDSKDDASDSPSKFKLATQVNHKYSFVRENLSKNNPIYVLGHSIGSYMAFNLMLTLKTNGYKTGLAVGLFPTIERMAETPNGRKLYSLLRFFDDYPLVAGCVTVWFDWMPATVKEYLIKKHFGSDRGVVPECVIESTVELFNSTVLSNIIHMARDELDVVNEYSFDLEPIKDLVYIYYGKEDGWAPLQFATDMLNRNQIPSDHIIIDDSHCEHAFVINDSITMADKMASLLGQYQPI
uniref:Lipid droplet-associated hydrolase n=1 Tax=Rhabditophanes sp. KR3021 TaxID=114890 RepID=A0AC35TKV5_9BILA